jgi:hypothetical protein
MIDPKLNELPTPRSGTAATAASERELSEAQEAERLKRSRAGLSINDTIAGDTNMSVGSRGVDTSGVRAGSGAGAGTTVLTPGRSSSPAPAIVQGSRGSGTTPRADIQTRASSDAIGGTDTLTGSSAAEDAGLGEPAHHEISARAYQCWHERGCPEGSPEVDWNRACDELRSRKPKTSAASA